jgi:hemerythrin
MQLLDSFSKSLEKGTDFASIKHVLDQFIEFSDMHFLSEQLVMRFHSYPAYEAHLQEHTRLMKKVREIRENVFRGERAPSLELIHELREWLLRHIATEDVAFGEFLKQKEGRL